MLSSLSSQTIGELLTSPSPGARDRFVSGAEVRPAVADPADRFTPRDLPPIPTVGPKKMPSLEPTASAPADLGARRHYIEDQLKGHDDLRQLIANVPDDDHSYEALIDILKEKYRVDVVDLGEPHEPYEVEDLLNLANQLNNLPDHIVEAYAKAGQDIRLVNGKVTEDPYFYTSRCLPVPKEGEPIGADGRAAAQYGGTHLYFNRSGEGTTFITLEALREDGKGQWSSGRVDSSDSTVLHELAHGLDNLGGDNNHFQEISHSAEFKALVADPEVWKYLKSISHGDYHTDPKNVQEHFAELFANYYASDELRAAIPEKARRFMQDLRLVA